MRCPDRESWGTTTSSHFFTESNRDVTVGSHFHQFANGDDLQSRPIPEESLIDNQSRMWKVTGSAGAFFEVFVFGSFWFD
tara:strand:- start:263757 stop:263996 length:240 start_codon:yes stop_codon:yes gene_type:complete